MMYVKGYVISYVPTFLEEKFGEYGLGQWMHLLQHRAFDIYSLGVDRSEWYPLKIALIEPMEKACDLFYNKSIRGAIDFGRYIADQEDKKELKFLPFKSSPGSRVKKACDAMQSIYDSAEISLAHMGTDNATIRVKNFPEMCEVIEVMTAGWLQRRLEHDLGRTISIEINNFSHSKECVEYIVKWKSN